MDMKKVAVLMSVYRRERPEWLRESLRSVYGQTLRPAQVVMVVDGPVGEELEAVLAEFPELTLVRLAENGGLGRALNEGLKHCEHELVARMDTDDVAEPTRLEKQARVFERYPQVEVVSCWIDEFEGEPANVVSTRRLPEFHYEIYEYGKRRCPVNHPAVMFRRGSVVMAGGYRHFPLFEDYYLWVRLLLSGAKFYNIQESLLRFRMSPDMFKRRGGWRHALTEVRFQNHIRRLGYIGWGRMTVNVGVRFAARIVPNGVRAFIYRRLLRR